MVMFWADSCDHEVLPNMGEGVEADRYALTIWCLADFDAIGQQCA
jgi:hypothetical protein